MHSNYLLIPCTVYAHRNWAINENAFFCFWSFCFSCDLADYIALFEANGGEGLYFLFFQMSVHDVHDRYGGERRGGGLGVGVGVELRVRVGEGELDIELEAELKVLDLDSDLDLGVVLDSEASLGEDLEAGMGLDFGLGLEEEAGLAAGFVAGLDLDLEAGADLEPLLLRFFALNSALFESG